jgi:hypothetical protein
VIIFVLLELDEKYVHAENFQGALKEFAEDWQDENDTDVRVYVVQE